MDTPTGDFKRGAIRVSDAERDQAVAELSEHFQAGRLTADEFEDRTGRTLQARTAADLASLFTDLPRQHPAAPAASAPGGAGPHLLARPLVAPIAIVAIVVLAAIISGHPGLIALVPVVALIIARRLTCTTRRNRG